MRTEVVCVNIEDPDIQSKASLWHSRIGHQGQSVLNEINAQYKLNIPQSVLQKGKNSSCTICTKGKIIRTAIHQAADPQYKVKEPLQCLHADLVGPITRTNRNSRPRCPSISGNIYAMIITDEATHAIFVTLLANKSDAGGELIKLIKRLQVRTGRVVERFHSDGGGEFTGTFFRQFLEENGTRFTHTTASTPQHNGVAERMNRTLFELTRTLLIEASASEEMWGEALLYAAHLYNVTPHPVSNNLAPFKLLYNYSFNIQKLRVWGCDAHVRILTDKQSKIQTRTWTGVFVGFDQETNSYRIMNPVTKSISKTNDLRFDEGSFTQLKGLTPSTTNSSSDYSYLNPFSILGEDLDDSELIEVDAEPAQTIDSIVDVETISSGVEVVSDESKSDDVDSVIDPPEINLSELEDDPVADQVESELNLDTEVNELDLGEDENDDPDEEAEEEQVVEPIQPSRSGNRELVSLRNQFNSWNSTHIHPQSVDANIHTRTRSGRASNSTQSIASNPNNYYSPDMHLALTQRAHEHVNVVKVDELINHEPQQYKDAVRSPDAAEWKLAMKEEIDSMNRLGVWIIVPCPKGVKPLKGRWVFKNKLGDNNQLIRRKARFVAKGFLQVYGRDFFETHSPVAKMKSIKLMLSIVASQDLELMQLDFDTAFLNAKVEEDIYMQQPEGFHVGDANMVCKLVKAIYGLRQASHNWNQTIDSFMKSRGYEPVRSDPCVYIKRFSSGRLIIICLYVDDTIIACDKRDLAIWKEDKQAIAAHYAIKDLGECQWILNMKVIRDRSNRIITLSQEAYIERILNEFNLSECRTHSIPAQTSELLLPIDNTKPVPLTWDEAATYQSMVGALLYAANVTRVDIAFIVGQLCRYTSKPCRHHYDAAVRVFRYLRGTSAACLIFGGSKPNSKLIEITAYTDANWGSDKQTGKSVSGGLIRFNGDLINWFSKRQKSVAQSSAESEYMALAETIKEVLWYRSIVFEIAGQRICATIKCDNQAAIKLSANDSIHDRSKHINIRYHFIRDVVNKKRVRIEWIDTKNQQADILTKALTRGLFIDQRNMLLLC
jgi:hypothetical protein